MSLAIATSTMPSWWEHEPDEVIATAIDILEAQAREANRGRS